MDGFLDGVDNDNVDSRSKNSDRRGADSKAHSETELHRDSGGRVDSKEGDRMAADDQNRDTHDCETSPLDSDAHILVGRHNLQ